MQDADLDFIALNASCNAYELTCRAFRQGNDLWRKLLAKGVYAHAPKNDITNAFFAAIESKDPAAARELVEAAFANERCREAAWLNRWFYEEDNSDYCNCIAKDVAEYPDRVFCSGSLSAALSVLSALGLDLAVREGLRVTDSQRTFDNGLHHLVHRASYEPADGQANIINLARVYLDLGVKMHESAQGPEESPLAFLLRRSDEQTLAPWANMLVEGGHLEQETLREFASIKLVNLETLKFVEEFVGSIISRRQILSIAKAGQATKARQP